MAGKRVSPIRGHLVPASTLRAQVADGLKAVAGAHRGYIHLDLRSLFGDSLDLDAAMEQEHPQANRWDYLLGVAEEGVVIGLEPHSASDDEVRTVTRKVTAARQQLRSHLQPGKQVTDWYWVASGKNRFANTEKTRLTLDQAGVTFVCPTLDARHLASARQRREKRKLRR